MSILCLSALRELPAAFQQNRKAFIERLSNDRFTLWCYVRLSSTVYFRNRSGMRVNMIVRDPLEGNSIYAKVVNLLFLNRAPAVAHRNRIAYLTRQLSNETKRVAREGRIARIYNLGCGPAVEVQNFLMQSDLCEATDLTLVDFNEETLRYTAQRLEDIRIGHGRDTRIHTVKKSVHQILKEAARFNEGPAYDFIYCAGLFDYRSEERRV